MQRELLQSKHHTVKKRMRKVSAAALLLLLLAAVLYAVNPGEGRGFVPCMVHMFTGLYCPGCGTARGIHALLHFDFYQALRFNPLSMLLLPFVLLYFAARAVDYVRTGQNHVDAHLNPKLLWGILAVALLFGILRNLPWFSWLAPTMVR